MFFFFAEEGATKNKFKIKDLLEKNIITNTELPEFAVKKSILEVSHRCFGNLELVIKMSGIEVYFFNLHLNQLLKMKRRNLETLDSMEIDTQNFIIFVEKYFILRKK